MSIQNSEQSAASESATPSAAQAVASSDMMVAPLAADTPPLVTNNQPLTLTDVHRDSAIQIRTSLHPAAVTAYAALLADRADALPPPVVFRVNGQYVLADGLHRFAAAERAGLTSLVC